MTYTPTQDYFGQDRFTFEVTDNSHTNSSPATINITYQHGLKIHLPMPKTLVSQWSRMLLQKV